MSQRLSFTNDGVPPGSQTSLGNWWKYQRFIPYGMRALFGEQYRLKVRPIT